jgi:hypothetical protein
VSDEGKNLKGLDLSIFGKGPVYIYFMKRGIGWETRGLGTINFWEGTSYIYIYILPLNFYFFL